MDKKIYAIGMTVVLVISVVALYLAISGPQKLGISFQEMIQRIGNEIQVLNNKSTPYIYTGNPVGYVIEFENGAKFYFAGDTALTYDMKFVAGDYYKADVAFLPIGDVYTMGVDSAAFAASVINPEGSPLSALKSKICSGTRPWNFSSVSFSSYRTMSFTPFFKK